MYFYIFSFPFFFFENYKSGCAWGLIHLFDFRQVHSLGSSFLIKSASTDRLKSAHRSDGFTISKIAGEIEIGHDGLLNEAELAAAAEEKKTYEFEIDPSQVNPDLDMELKPHAQPRPYQEKSLSKMFGNGRARSGIIVLPCGVGKSLVGVSAASRIKTSCLCLATNAGLVDQWAFQFKLWSTIRDEQIFRFTSDSKERFRGNAGVVVTIYNMVAFGVSGLKNSKRLLKR
ncbi:hypothetical protein DITRI_Ditri03aG0144900 [Diplodiscus trichospermus]